MKVLIEVTQTDIEDGQPRTACYCPVAIATHRALPDAKRVYAHPLQIDVVFDNFVGVEVPPAAAAFMRAFDLGENVAPFSFEIEVPQEQTP